MKLMFCVLLGVPYGTIINYSSVNITILKRSDIYNKIERHMILCI